MLCPQPHRTAKIASPVVPFSVQRARRPSDFMWPIPGSMALPRRSRFASAGVIPFRVPLISTFVFSTSCPRIMPAVAAVDNRQGGLLPGQCLDLLQRFSQRMPVTGGSRQGPHANDEAPGRPRTPPPMVVAMLTLVPNS